MTVSEYRSDGSVLKSAQQARTVFNHRWLRGATAQDPDRDHHISLDFGAGQSIRGAMKRDRETLMLERLA